MTCKNEASDARGAPIGEAGAQFSVIRSDEPAVSKSAVIGAYRRYAKYYDILFGAALESGRLALAKEVDQLGFGSLLEIGVGTGLMLERYGPDCDVVGVDISQEMLDIATARAARLDLQRVRLMLCDGETLPFRDGEFDCVILPYVLSVTPDPGRLLAEANRVCRDTGRILVLNHFSGSRFWWVAEKMLKNMAGKIGFRSHFSLQQNVIAHGFVIEKMRSANFLGLSKILVLAKKRQ